jgi:DNA-binding winged helix-turn-helix (wHTH) protein
MSTQLVPIHSPEGQISSNGSPVSPSRYLRFGIFHLDLQREELFKDGTRVKLQGKVYQALLALLEKPGEIVTREALRMRLWPADTFVNYDANVNTTVNKLRQVLGDSPEQPAFVETIPRQGYSFVAKVEHVDQPAARQARSQAGLLPDTLDRNQPEPNTSFIRSALSSRWFSAGVITLVLASMLFGAALVLYAHRGL